MSLTLYLSSPASVIDKVKMMRSCEARIVIVLTYCCYFQVLIKGVDLDLISRQVLPALVTLASDSQM